MQDDVSLVGQHPDMVKRTISIQDVWESPRPPFEVPLQCPAVMTPPDGRSQ